MENDKLEETIIYLNTNLSSIDLQLLVNQYSSINKFCKDKCNSTLLYRYLTNTLLFTFFESKLNNINEHYIIINGERFIQKKINGKPCNFLDLVDSEKNDNTEENNNIEENNDIEEIQDYFQYHVLIINLKSEKWWKHKPSSIKNNNFKYNDIIEAGIYIINKNDCNKYIKIENKKPSINNIYLYKILKNSVNRNLYIKFPNKSEKITKFNILNAFV